MPLTRRDLFAFFAGSAVATPALAKGRASGSLNCEPSRLSEAGDVAPIEIILETLELDHPTFSEPMRIAIGVTDDIALPLFRGGPTALFMPAAIELIPPIIRFCGVLPLALMALASGRVFGTYRAYIASDTSQPRYASSFEIRDVKPVGDSIEGRLNYQLLYGAPRDFL